MDDQAKLTKIRDDILEELTPLLSRSSIEPEEKFALQLAAARSGGQVARFEEAAESARQISDDTAKGNAFLDLLETIDRQLGDEPEKTAEQPLEQPAPQEEVGQEQEEETAQEEAAEN